MVAKKHKSKRVSCSMRYKVEKKVRDHRKKARRDAKRNPQHKAKKKDPGIPNLWPMKEKLLQDIEDRKMRLEEEKQRQKKQRADIIAKNRKNQLEGMVADAENRAEEFDNAAEEEANEYDSFVVGEYTDGTVMGNRDNSKKAYYKEFKKVVENADVVLIVLDARDPMGCRVKKVEEMILASGGTKRIVLVLNKIDLVPRDVVEKWLKYLRNEFPTIAFKASTQQQRHNLGQSSLNLSIASQKSISGTSECLGADDLIKLLKNYSRNADIKTSITVGVIGYPNVGKSSIINSLKRAKVCDVGSTPGLTKCAQVISLDKNLKLLDCPGIVFSQGGKDKKSSAESVLRNCIKVGLIEDPIGPVEVIVSRVSHDQLTSHYQIPAFGNVKDFLIAVAKSKGRIKKKGIPDIKGAARSVIEDWNSGKISYYSMPPATTQNQISSEIVQGWSKEFQLDDLKSSEEILLAKVGNEQNGCKFIKAKSMELDVDMDAELPYEYAPSEESEEDQMMTDEECPEGVAIEGEEEEGMEVSDAEVESEMQQPIISLKNKKQAKPAVTKQKIINDEEMELNPQHGKQMKKMLKKQKKLKIKESRHMEEDSYEFGSYFN